jgi:hypothetical protein
MRQLMQALGNCNQPLEHRGPISINPSPLRREAGPGFYGGGAWSPSDFSSLIDASSVFNSQAFVDSSAKNNFFGGDNFLFNTDANFVTNNFPTTIVLGQPGTPGQDGEQGDRGERGERGRSGVITLAGRDGVDGGVGPPGQPGGGGLPGPVGGPAPVRRPGGYRLVPGEPGRDIDITDMIRRTLRTYAVPVSISVPQYELNEECEIVLKSSYASTLDPSGKIAFTVKADVRIEGREGFTLPPTLKLQPKPFYP